MLCAAQADCTLHGAHGRGAASDRRRAPPMRDDARRGAAATIHGSKFERNGCLHLLPGSRAGVALGVYGTPIVPCPCLKTATPVVPLVGSAAPAFSNLRCYTRALSTTDEMRWSVDLRYVVVNPPRRGTRSGRTSPLSTTNTGCD